MPPPSWRALDWGEESSSSSQNSSFSQGDTADSVFYLRKGRARLTVVSTSGKEATIALISAAEFVGEESIAGAVGLRLATATAISSCTALKIERGEIIRVLHEEHSFSDLFLKFLLARSMRTQADLVDQLFNSSEKRLPRILLLLAEFGKPGEPEPLIPEITQGNSGRDDWNDPVARQLLHEPLSQTRLHRIQRPHQGSQVVAQRRSARLRNTPRRRSKRDCRTVRPRGHQLAASGARVGCSIDAPWPGTS
jgi:hypothetical protein